MTPEILSKNTAAYELLFELMDVKNDKINEKAWSLIQRLPNNPQWATVFENIIDAKQCLEQLPLKSIHHILYLLEIMSNYIIGEDNINWIQKFISNGWIHFLIDIMSMKYFSIDQINDQLLLSHARKTLYYSTKFTLLFVYCYTMNNNSKFESFVHIEEKQQHPMCNEIYIALKNEGISSVTQLRDALKESI